MDSKENSKKRGRKPTLTHLSAEERLARIKEQCNKASLKYYYKHKCKKVKS